VSKSMTIAAFLAIKFDEKLSIKILFKNMIKNKFFFTFC